MNSVLFILGFGILGGLVGGVLFKKLHIPQVIGYIVIGLAVGATGFNLIKIEDIQALEPFNLFALGIIGFLVGGELKLDSFRDYGGQFAAILLGEGLAAFVLVGLPVGLIVYFVCHNIPVAFATGIVFGAIASATDPASTISVLWEYRSLGVLTTSLTAIVALDDALAMTLYGVGTGVAQILTSGHGSILGGLAKVSMELLGAVALGALMGVILVGVLRYVLEPERCLAFALGLILLVISLAVTIHADVILAAMTLGFVLTNVTPRKSEELFKVMRGFSIPIYVLFFVLVGARINLAGMPWWLWAIVGVYVLGRSFGKMFGAYVGAKMTGSPDVVCRYLGTGLFAQGGVAIGLSIMASHHLSGIQLTETMALGDAIICGVATTTFIVQLIGPPMVKWAITKADEAGRDITKEDIIAGWTAKDAMKEDVDTISEHELLGSIINRFSEKDNLFYLVANQAGQMVGGLSLETLKSVLIDQESWRWLVASDVMCSLDHRVTEQSPLHAVLETMDQYRLERMPVVKTDGSDVPVGLIDMADLKHRVDREILRRRRSDHV